MRELLLDFDEEIREMFDVLKQLVVGVAGFDVDEKKREK